MDKKLSSGPECERGLKIQELDIRHYSYRWKCLLLKQGFVYTYFEQFIYKNPMSTNSTGRNKLSKTELI